MEVCATPHSPASEELRTIQQRKYKYDTAAPSGVASSKGKPIGYRRKDGYWLLSYGGKHILAHRVVWVLHNGAIPDGLVIDHINRNPSDNRIENLRLATVSLNNSNSRVRSHCKSGEKYIALDSRTGRFSVRIRRVSYGTYDSLEEAVKVRDSVLNTTH